MASKNSRRLVRTAVLLVTAILLVVSCGDKDNPTRPAPAEGVRVTTQTTVYAVGDTVRAIAFNDTEDTIEVLQCCDRPMLAAQVWRDTAWVFDTSLIAWCNCYGPIDMLVPPQSRIDCFVPMLFTEPGRYRLRLSVGDFDLSHWPTPREYYYSNEFTFR